VWRYDGFAAGRSSYSGRCSARSGYGRTAWARASGITERNHRSRDFAIRLAMPVSDGTFEKVLCRAGAVALLSLVQRKESSNIRMMEDRQMRLTLKSRAKCVNGRSRAADCSSSTERPSRSVPSNTASPVELAKSPRTMVSFSVRCGVRRGPPEQSSRYSRGEHYKAAVTTIFRPRIGCDPLTPAAVPPAAIYPVTGAINDTRAAACLDEPDYPPIARARVAC